MSEEDDFEERLINWGRWARGRPKRNMSPLAKLQLPEEEEEQRVPPVDPVDVEDALLIQAAWQRMPMAPLRYKAIKLLIGYSYAYRQVDPVRLIRRRHRIAIREREVEQMMVYGRRMMMNIVRQIGERSGKS